MDSKVVNKQIREVIRPYLKENGFTKFTARNSWRYHEDRIDVINFQSFNSYNADVMGCTTFSFALNLGCFFSYIPKEYPIKEKNGLLRPNEYECHFRLPLKKGFKQKKGFLINKYARNDIWYIDKNGGNLVDVIVDAKAQIANIGLSWFEPFKSPKEVLRILREEEEDMDSLKGLWGFGTNPSPCRSLFTGYTALHLNQIELAEKSFQEVIDSDCYKGFFTSIDEAKKKVLG